MQVAMGVIRHEGYRALLVRGLGPRVLKRSLQASITWTAYEELVKLSRSLVVH